MVAKWHRRVLVSGLLRGEVRRAGGVGAAVGGQVATVRRGAVRLGFGAGVPFGAPLVLE